MTENKKDIVSYIAFESEMTRLERIVHRLWIMCLALLVALLATNIGWIIYESQFEYFTETTEVTQDATDGGTNNYIGGDYNGETENKDN